MTTTQKTFGFLGRDYQYKLVYNTFWDPDFGGRMLPHLQPSLIEHNTLASMILLGRNYFEKYSQVPNVENLKQLIELEVGNELEQESLYRALDRLINLHGQYQQNVIQNDTKFVKESAERFLVRQRTQSVLDEAQRRVDSDNHESMLEIPELLRSAMSVGEDGGWGTSVTEFDESMLEAKYLDAIPLGIPAIDKIIGGLPKKKMGMILAGSGIGKSSLLTLIGDHAYSIQGKRVLHLVFDENDEKEVKGLYWAKWTKIETKDFTNQKDLVRARFKEYIREHTQGSLTVKQFPSEGITIPRIKNWILELQKLQGFKFDMIILDYIEEVDSHKPNRDDWQAQTDVAKAFKSMLVELDIPGWTATQGTRKANDEAWLTFEHMGGALAKLKKAQLVISVGADVAMRNNNMVNLLLLKCNYAPCGHRFENCKFNRALIELDVEEAWTGLLPESVIRMGIDEEDESDFVFLPKDTTPPPKMGVNRTNSPSPEIPVLVKPISQDYKPNQGLPKSRFEDEPSENTPFTVTASTSTDMVRDLVKDIDFS